MIAVRLTVCTVVRIVLCMGRNAIRRYETMVTRTNLPAMAWTGLAIRMELEAKATTSGRREKLLARAEDCRGRADSARSRDLRCAS